MHKSAREKSTTRIRPGPDPPEFEPELIPDKKGLKPAQCRFQAFLFCQGFLPPCPMADLPSCPVTESVRASGFHARTTEPLPGAQRPLRPRAHRKIRSDVRR